MVGQGSGWDPLTVVTEASRDNRVIPLEGGRGYVLANPYELDGMTHTFPVWARGYAPSNSYLLIEDDEALLVDAGLSVHEDALLGQIGELIGDRRLALYVTRFGEFNTICNVHAIVENFEVSALYAPWPDASLWMEVRPKYAPPGTRVGSGPLGRLANVKTADGKAIRLGGERRITPVRATLRLLTTDWLYDHGTGTLFTSDAFTHVWRESAAGPWAVQPEEDDGTTAEQVLDYMTATRFWWLNGADTEPLIRRLGEAFARFPDVRAIGPGYGCALLGQSVARRHLRLVEDALRLAATRTPNGVDLGLTYQDATDPSLPEAATP